jgi:serine/threonine protein kinase
MKVSKMSPPKLLQDKYCPDKKSKRSANNNVIVYESGETEHDCSASSFDLTDELLEIQLQDLEKHTILGEGTFGQVWLVTTTKSSLPYALKIMAKYDLAIENQLEGAMQEKNTLISMHHPFISKLFNTYQEEHYIYFLLEFYAGGELFTLMHTHKEDDSAGLNETQAKFYALCVADALAYLHKRKIAFRDLKPENVMIDVRGYAVLIDFGFAKRVLSGKTFTLCGTPRFAAPEMITTEGHDYTVDYWQLGVLIYEMITGENPFSFDGQDQSDLFKSIVEDEPPSPPGASSEATDLVVSLIIKAPKQRLPDLAILRHEWFSELNLNQMRGRVAKAPWVPDLKDALDVSCFDDWAAEGLVDTTTIPRANITQKQQEILKNF